MVLIVFSAVLGLACLAIFCLWLFRRKSGNGRIDHGPLERELALAAEHVHSIRLLLEISHSHQQPVPRAAIRNLELVSKHLREIQLRLDPGLSAAESPDPALPPRRLSSECRVSPSGK